MAQRNDIEDVLSSIRRLVSEGAAAPVDELIFVKPVETLLLDPAQRVIDADDPFQKIAGVPTAPDEADSLQMHAEAALAEQSPPAETIDVVETPAEEPPHAPEEDASAPLPAEEMIDIEEIAVEEPPHVPEEDTSSSLPAQTPDRSEADADALDLSDLSEAVGSDDALRDLIAEVVRQELAGALGERITRNVRKLVRREVRQMMSGEEFD